MSYCKHLAKTIYNCVKEGTNFIERLEIYHAIVPVHDLLQLTLNPES